MFDWPAKLEPSAIHTVSAFEPSWRLINGSEILLGSPFTFTKDNIKDFDF
jgi:hypothetical protein